jgi:hypothetical protein
MNDELRKMYKWKQIILRHKPGETEEIYEELQ